jgi:two-component system, OmpR family, response regulator ChvI
MGQKIPAKGGAPQILIVDDEKDITAALKTGLEKKGFNVDVYNDPQEALAKAEPNRYDLAIFDIRMPNMNGFDLYRQFKKLDGKTDVCFFTAFDIHKGEYDDLFPDVNVKAFLKNP